MLRLLAKPLPGTVVSGKLDTMPALGINTPKGEVAKVDASLNQTTGLDKSNAGTKTTGKRANKAKARKAKPMQMPQ